MKDEINNILSSMVDSIEDEKYEKNKSIVEHLEENFGMYFENPYDFYVMCVMLLHDPIEVLVKQRYPNISLNDYKKISFIYVNYPLIKSHIEKLVDMYVGGTCDISNFLVKTYINYVVKKETITIDHNKFNNPDFGTFEEWMSYIDKLIMFLKGYIDLETFSNAYNILLEQKKNIGR